MLEKARKLDCYDDLALGDAVELLCGEWALDNRLFHGPPAVVTMKSPLMENHGSGGVGCVVAADVLVYIGDLRPLLEACARVLRRKHGLFVCSTEAIDFKDLAPQLLAPCSEMDIDCTVDDEPTRILRAESSATSTFDGPNQRDSCRGWRLRKQGRFVHMREYISKVARVTGFEVMMERRAILRKSAGNPVWGHIHILRRQ